MTIYPSLEFAAKSIRILNLVYSVDYTVFGKAGFSYTILEKHIFLYHIFSYTIPGSSDDKESACNAGDPGSIPSQEDPLDKGMATHSSILSWRIPWTEESGVIQSMGSQRVRHH